MPQRQCDDVPWWFWGTFRLLLSTPLSLLAKDAHVDRDLSGWCPESSCNAGQGARGLALPAPLIAPSWVLETNWYLSDSMPFVQYFLDQFLQRKRNQKEFQDVPRARCSVFFSSQEVKTRQSQAKQERKRLCAGMCRAVADHLSIICFPYSNVLQSRGQVLAETWRQPNGVAFVDTLVLVIILWSSWRPGAVTTSKCRCLDDVGRCWTVSGPRRLMNTRLSPSTMSNKSCIHWRSFEMSKTTPEKLKCHWLVMEQAGCGESFNIPYKKQQTHTQSLIQPFF